MYYLDSSAKILSGVKSKGAREGRDLTLIGGVDRRVRLPLSKWRGYGVESLSAPDGVFGFQNNAWFQDGLSFSPLGETGEG